MGRGRRAAVPRHTYSAARRRLPRLLQGSPRHIRELMTTIHFDFDCDGTIHKTLKLYSLQSLTRESAAREHSVLRPQRGTTKFNTLNNYIGM